MSVRSVCIGVACALPGVQAEISATKIAEWDIPEVATLQPALNLPGIKGLSLVGTTFGPDGTDYVFALGPLSVGQSAQKKNLSSEFLWPNEVREVSQDDAKHAGLDGEFLTVADGFLVPFTGKNTGSVSLLKLGSGLSAERTKISEDKKNWFYHHVEWTDVDGDGILDAVSARSTVPIPFGKTNSQLIWIKSNGDGTFGSTEVIVDGPGVAFRFIDIDGDGKTEVVATEFFLHQQLAVYSCTLSTWAECASTKNSIIETTIDNGDGPWFDLEWVDLNGDGKKEILCTSQQFKTGIKPFQTQHDGSVWAFEIPDGWTAGSQVGWTRHLLGTGYLPQPKQEQGSGAPGAPSSFILDTSVGGRNGPNKPHILLSGDDGGMIDILAPNSQDPDDWTYTTQTVYSTTTADGQGLYTVGTPRAFDVNGDGLAELFVPAYSENKLLMYSLSSSKLAVSV